MAFVAVFALLFYFDDIVGRLVAAIEEKGEGGEEEPEEDLPQAIGPLPIISIAFLVQTGAESSPLEVQAVEGDEAVREDASILPDLASHLEYEHQNNECKCDSLYCDCRSTMEQLVAPHDHQEHQAEEDEDHAHQDVLGAVGSIVLCVLNQPLIDQICRSQDLKHLHDEEDCAQVLGNWQVVQVEEGAVDPPRGDKSGADDEELDGPAAIVHMCSDFVSGERNDEDD